MVHRPQVSLVVCAAFIGFEVQRRARSSTVQPVPRRLGQRCLPEGGRTYHRFGTKFWSYQSEGAL